MTTGRMCGRGGRAMELGFIGWLVVSMIAISEGLSPESALRLYNSPMVTVSLDSYNTRPSNGLLIKYNVLSSV